MKKYLWQEKCGDNLKGLFDSVNKQFLGRVVKNM